MFFTQIFNIQERIINEYLENIKKKTIELNI